MIIPKLRGSSTRLDNDSHREPIDPEESWDSDAPPTTNYVVGFLAVDRSYRGDTRSVFTQAKRKAENKSSTYLANKYLANSQLVILDTPPKVTRYLLFPFGAPKCSQLYDYCAPPGTRPDRKTHAPVSTLLFM